MILVTPDSLSVCTFCSANAWNTYSLPIRRAGSPVQLSRGPRIANSTPAFCSSLAVASAVRRARSSNEDAQPTQYRYSGAGSPGSRILTPELRRPVGALGLRLAPGVRRALDVAEHRLGLRREARLDHHQVTAQVDDVVDVLDRHRARLHARAAGDAVPYRLLGHGAGDQRRLLLGEHVVAQAHDHELGRQRLVGAPGRARVLAAAALRARVGVEHLLPGQVGGRARAEPELLLGHRLVVEPQRLQPAARAGAPEPHVDRRGRDVQVLGAGQVGQEREDRQHVRPDEHPLEDSGCLIVAEQVRQRLGDRGPRRRPLVEAERDPGGVPQQQRDHDRGDQAPGSGRPRRDGCPRTGAAAGPCGSRARPARRPAPARRTGRPSPRTSPGGRARGAWRPCRPPRSARSGSWAPAPGSPRR